MLSQNRLIWIGLIVVISLGLMIEALKSTRSTQEGSSWRPRIFGLLDDDDGSEGLEHRNVKANRARSRLLKGRVAGLAENSPFKTTVTTAAVPGPPIPNLIPLSANKMSDADKKKALEAAAKKKKKKKKKSDEKQEVAAEPAPTSSIDDDGKANSDVSGGGATSFAGANQRMVTLGGTSDSENPETLEQWLAYILREPNYDRTVKLIKAHEMHTVDAEIFHEVITQMLADARGKMHEYAIYALESAPSLKSFILLVSANANEPVGSQLKIMSRTALTAYSKIENLRYLANVISSGEEFATSYEALRMIQLAVANYKPTTTSPPSGPKTSGTPMSRQLSSLVPVLMRVSDMAADASLRDEAKTTLRMVQNIVGTTTPVASLNQPDVR